MWPPCRSRQDRLRPTVQPSRSRETCGLNFSSGVTSIPRTRAASLTERPVSVPAVATKPALLLIADIGGYTEYMQFHRGLLGHAEAATTRLLEGVVNAAR